LCRAPSLHKVRSLTPKRHTLANFVLSHVVQYYLRILFELLFPKEKHIDMSKLIRFKHIQRQIQLALYTLTIGLPGVVILGLLSNIVNDKLTNASLVSLQDIANAIRPHLLIIIVGVMVWIVGASAAVYLRTQELRRSAKQLLRTKAVPIGSADKGRDRQNQLTVLNKVRRFWIEGVLENSLHGTLMLELGLTNMPDAVVYPWQMIVRQPNGSSQKLPAGYLTEKSGATRRRGPRWSRSGLRPSVA